MLTKCLKLAALSPVASLLLVKSCYLPSKKRCSFPKKKKIELHHWCWGESGPAWSVASLFQLKFSSTALTACKIFGQDSCQMLPLMCDTTPALPPHLKHPNYHFCQSGVREQTQRFLTGWKLPQDTTQVMQLINDVLWGLKGRVCCFVTPDWFKPLLTQGLLI